MFHEFVINRDSQKKAHQDMKTYTETRDSYAQDIATEWDEERELIDWQKKQQGKMKDQRREEYRDEDYR